MNTSKTTATIVGLLFIIAMVTSLLGGSVLESSLNAPDFLMSFAANTNQVSLGVLLELINAIAVIGIAIMMFPILKNFNERIAIGYVSFRIIESIMCIASAIIPLSLRVLSQRFLEAGEMSVTHLQTLGTILTTARADFANILIPIFFCLSALMFYYILYRSKLIPRFISAWGLIGVILLLPLNLYELSMTFNLMLALPIILNEIVLGVWLIVKGFRTPALTSIN